MKQAFVFAPTLLLSAPLTLGPMAHAHDGATGIVEERMHSMKEMGKAVRAVKAMVQDPEAYDAESARKQAEIIKQHAGQNLVDQFPEGSLQAPTHAKPEIWTDWERFSQLSSQLESYADGLTLAADNGVMMDGSMMSGAMMEGAGHMGSMMGTDAYEANQLGQMPADGVFTMMVETCSACHMEFRARKP
ncbi:c-type cytochrome [Cohaesibacter marisflavi]|uniref:c-type cytochrome n=1 Tax=Cohaesibacter marisflavi TaxID=655353 RepID=UPI0029C68788|nr:cytochrome c [Cohaesibacter marisflavi]